ncbi:MAG: prephenate dehydrogenase/arogenate dehydrogenase family protein [Desulfonatronovibrionaceae bacterium]
MIEQIAVVGARGAMGGLLSRSFSRAGCQVVALDKPLPVEDIPGMLQDIQLVLVSVPISVFSDVVETVAPAMPSEAILADVCSVKVLPMKSMEKFFPGPVLGTHPLFGPEPGADQELKTVMCPGRNISEKEVAMVENLFLRAGMKTFRASADEHDKAMACIQSLNYVTTVSYFASLPDDLDLGRFATPSFMRRITSARKMINQDSSLFSALAEDNPYTGQMIRRFKSFLNLSAAGELELLQDKALWWWRNDNSKTGG